MYKKLWLVPFLFISILWQPSHHYLMASGLPMNSGVHSLATMAPFLAILLLLIR